jgi:lipoprotein-releasing system ATP-binding protein
MVTMPMDDGDAPLLRTEDVHKTYGDGVETHALRGVTLDLAAGEICALTGPSGCGKTTLLNLMGLLDRPTEGRILIRGVDTTDLDDDARTTLRAEALGFIFQFHHLLMAFTALENVVIPLLSRHGRAAPWMWEKAADLLERMDLAERAHHRANDLSGGQQQRVAVARALVMDPALVLADEPTGNLDSEAGDRVLDVLREINVERGTAFLVVTHDARVAQRCDRIVHMIDGRIDTDTAPDPSADMDASRG